MTLMSYDVKGKNDIGGSRVFAEILSDTTPETLPVTGADVEGMEDNYTFAPGSLIYVVDKNADPKYYIANESGVFVAQ